MRYETRRWGAAILVAAILCVSGCARKESAGADQASFGTPEEALTALVTAIEKRDTVEFRRLLGLEHRLLSSGDPVEDSLARESFLERYRAKHRLVAGGPNDIVLQVGEDDWPLPIPIVRQDGRWRFDGPAGADELVLRRIGANELRTIDVMRGFVAAQVDYARRPHDGAPAGAFAQKFRSDPGRQNGLYWEVEPGQAPSPAGPLLAAAAAEGYTGARGADAPYHGYHFRMLESQGPAAPGGARDYVVDGRPTAGFALLAWPASYGSSGVMTFIVNQDGTVWQRDLGKDTEKAGPAIQQFNPDSTWTPIPQD